MDLTSIATGVSERLNAHEPFFAIFSVNHDVDVKVIDQSLRYSVGKLTTEERAEELYIYRPDNVRGNVYIVAHIPEFHNYELLYGFMAALAISNKAEMEISTSFDMDSITFERYLKHTMIQFFQQLNRDIDDYCMYTELVGLNRFKITMELRKDRLRPDDDDDELLEEVPLYTYSGKLIDESVRHLDPNDAGLSDELKLKIAKECQANPAYYLKLMATKRV